VTQHSRRAVQWSDRGALRRVDGWAWVLRTNLRIRHGV